MFKFDPAKLKNDEELGSSSSGNVFPYKEGESYEKWAVKYIHVTKMTDFQNVLQEIVLGFNHSHPAILPIIGFYVEADNPAGFKIYIKMPRMKQSLRRIIQKQEDISKEQLLKY